MLSTPPCIGQPTSSPAMPENPNEGVTSSSAQDRIVHHGGLGDLRARLRWPAVASAKAGGRRGGIPKRRMTSQVLQFSRRDVIAERLGIETVQPSIGGLGLWVHEESKSGAFRARQRHVVRHVE